LTLINCTFCGNRSANGTAVYTLNSKLDITSCTFADNRHYDFLSSGQAVAIFYSDVNIRNSIFNDNQSEIYGTITSGGYNVFPSKYTLKYCTILGDTVTNKYCTGNFYYTTNGYVIMAENEFWIPTCAIKSTSCCIDALPSDGNGAPTYDERGFVRLNNSDIGAFEYGGIVPTLEVSTTELTIGALANSTKTFDITSNTSWSVISNQTWLTVSSPTGYNNTTMTLTAQANPTTHTRVAIVTVSGENVTSKIITVTQDAGTSGILDNENRNFLIYPNPTNNFLYIDSSINKASIIIIDINGKFLLSRNEITDNKIDISRLQNGLYILKIETDKGIIVRRFLKIN